MTDKPTTASVTDLSPSAVAHLKSVAAFYNQTDLEAKWTARTYREMLAHYYNLLIPSSASVLEIGCGGGGLLSRLRARRRVGIDLSERQIQRARERIPDGCFYVQSGEALALEEKFDYIIVSDTVNYAGDVQQLLLRLQRVSHTQTRLILNFHNTVWWPAFSLATTLGLRARHPESSWLSRSDIHTFLDLADWEVLRTFSQILSPVRLFGLGSWINRYLAPLLSHVCLTIFCVARPRRIHPPESFTTSIIIPARDEAGNIEAAVRRTPCLGSKTEIIFVENHSRDETWQEMQRVQQAFPEKHITCLRQPRIGKVYAVRLGMAEAKGDVLMILDADLTMPPEELPKFYDVIVTGRADFANGVRLVYPMEEEAMRFLNLCANKAFSILFTWLLGHSIKDTLCGTKAILRADYERLVANRSYFGEFDPFGDFDLLFGARKLNLKIADVAIRYTGRTYGSTKISRWRDGWLLLRMALVAAKKLKFV